MTISQGMLVLGIAIGGIVMSVIWLIVEEFKDVLNNSDTKTGAKQDK
jgi:hypothetical protein